MKVYVVMGNDFPDGVFDSGAGAAAYCQRKQAEPESKHESGGQRIYWRMYEFELRADAPEAKIDMDRMLDNAARAYWARHDHD